MYVYVLNILSPALCVFLFLKFFPLIHVPISLFLSTCWSTSLFNCLIFLFVFVSFLWKPVCWFVNFPAYLLSSYIAFLICCVSLFNPSVAVSLLLCVYLFLHLPFVLFLYFYTSPSFCQHILVHDSSKYLFGIPFCVFIFFIIIGSMLENINSNCYRHTMLSNLDTGDEVKTTLNSAVSINS